MYFLLFLWKAPDLFPLRNWGNLGIPLPLGSCLNPKEKGRRGMCLGAAVGSRVKGMEEKEEAPPEQAPSLSTPHHPALIIIIRALMRIC